MAVERLESESAQNLLNNVDNFLLDADGVLWDINGTIEGGREAVVVLKSKNKKVYFISNNSVYTQEDYVTKLEKHGFHIQKVSAVNFAPCFQDEVFSTAHLSALYLNSTGFQGTAYVVGTASIGKELDKLGISHTGTGPDFEGIEKEREMWVNTKLDQKVTGVIVGFDNYFSVKKILLAASYLQRPDTLFLVTNEDTTFPGSKNIVIPELCAMVVAVKVMAKREPVVLGKPHRLFFKMIQRQIPLDPSRCCVVGDGLITDIGLARAIGSKSLLVLTGNATQTDVGQLTSGESDLPRPDYFTNSLADLCSLMA